MTGVQTCALPILENGKKSGNTDWISTGILDFTKKEQKNDIKITEKKIGKWKSGYAHRFEK